MEQIQATGRTSYRGVDGPSLAPLSVMAAIIVVLLGLVMVAAECRIQGGAETAADVEIDQPWPAE